MGLERPHTLRKSRPDWFAFGDDKLQQKYQAGPRSFSENEKLRLLETSWKACEALQVQLRKAVGVVPTQTAASVAYGGSSVSGPYGQMTPECRRTCPRGHGTHGDSDFVPRPCARRGHHVQRGKAWPCPVTTGTGDDVSSCFSPGPATCSPQHVPPSCRRCLPASLHLSVT